MSLDTPFAVYGPNKSALKLLIAAVLCAELGEFPPMPNDEVDVAEEIAKKSEQYALYLSLFFIVSRRKKVGTSLPGPSRGSEVKGEIR